MATIEITVPNDKVSLVKAALGYSDTILDENGVEQPNPVGAAAFFQNWVADQVKRRIKNYERRQFIQQATYTDVDGIQ